MHHSSYRTVVSLILLLGLTACAANSEAPPQAAPAMTQQNECVMIADRSERDRCLEAAALGSGN